MKIALLNYGLPPYQIGGAETYTEEIARALHELGNSVSVICYTTPEEGSDSFVVKEEVRDGLNVIRVSFGIHDNTRYMVSPELYRWSTQWLEHNRPDIIYAGMFWYLLGVLKAACDLSIPCILTTHGYDFFCLKCNLLNASGAMCSPPVPKENCIKCAMGNTNGKLSFPMRFLLRTGSISGLSRLVRSDRIRFMGNVVQSMSEMEEARKWLLKHVSAIVCPSRFCLDQHKRVFEDFDGLCHIPNGLDSKRFSGIGPIHVNDKVIFSFIGRIDPFKGIDTAIRAFRQVPREKNVELRIYGDPDHPWSRDYARTLKIEAEGDERISFRGEVRGEGLLTAYREMSALILPTISENLSITIQEALAAGRPVICSEVGGNSEMVKNNLNGLTFPPGDVQALRNSMMRIIDEPGLLERLASNAKPYQDIRDSAAELKAIFERAIKEK